MTKNVSNKPIIETIINTAALAISAFGVNLVIQDICWWKGLLFITFASTLEYFKYFGRQKKLW